MELVTMYKAKNGRLFEDEAECKSYELYLDYSDTICEIYRKYSEYDRSYYEIFKVEKDFVAEVAKTFDLEIKCTDFGNDIKLYKFVPKTNCENAEEKVKAWNEFERRHIMSW